MSEPAPQVSEAVERLTARERECLRLVNQHLSSKEIGRLLGVSKYTVDTHLDRARERLGVGDRYAAARLMLAYEASVGTPPSPVPTASGPHAVGMVSGPGTPLAHPVSEGADLDRYGAHHGERAGGGERQLRPVDPPRGAALRAQLAADGPSSHSPVVFSWEQLERQLTALAATPAQAAMCRDLVSGVRKQAPGKPSEMILREVLCLAGVIMDETFRPEFGEDAMS
ncbi:MAG: helix-turn-helix transcriptional regulator [Caulobacteraceae bacterium]|nr:helix-turn-helix transcriptional regulator [Caulobacteraceae bacterium]